MTARETGFVGIDLAWGVKARTGLAVVDDEGRLVESGAVRTDDEIQEWLRALGREIFVVAVDAPLIVPNETGQRRCETEISRAFWRHKIGAHSSNKGRAEFNPPRAAVLAERLGWSVDPAHEASAGATVCIEVYPHPAMVGLFGLPERIAYKSGPSRQAGFGQLIEHLASISELRLSESARWIELSQVVANPAPGELNRIEDELDAILCAHLAWLWQHRRDGLKVYGSLEEGYIIAPPAPVAGSTSANDSGSPPVPTSSSLPAPISVDVVGRPTGYAGGDNEQRWKAAVRSALAGSAVRPGTRIALQIEYRLEPGQTGQNAPDLDNLLKATIDAMDGVLGRRPGGFSRQQADDERIDRIVASKRLVGTTENPGALLVVTELGRP